MLNDLALKFSHFLAWGIVFIFLCANIALGEQKANNKMINYTPDDGLPNEQVTALLLDGDSIWAGTWGGLARIKNGKVEKVYQENSPLSESITCIGGNNDNLWVGHSGFGQGGGLAHFNGKSWDYHQEPGNIIAVATWKDTVFCGTWEKGVLYLKEGKWESLPAIGDSRITCLYTVDDTLWAGTKGSGASSIQLKEPFSQQEWTVYDEHTSRIINNSVTDIFSINNGMWFTTWGGASYLSSSLEWSHYTDWENKLANNFVTCVFANNRTVVFGTRKGLTLHTIGSDSWRTLCCADGLISNEINDIIIDDNVIWAATSKGLISITL